MPNSYPSILPVTIPNGGALSAAVDLGGSLLSGLWVPSTWTAANITFQTSPDGVQAYSDYHVANASAEYLVTVTTAGQYFLMRFDDFFGVRWIKVRSGTGGTPVNQGGNRIVTLALRPYTF